MDNPEPISTTPQTSWFARVAEHALDYTVGALTVLLLLIFFWPSTVVTVLPGHAGVIWRPYRGTDISEIYGEGVYFIAPWNRFYIYDVWLQEKAITYEVIAKNALHVQMETSIRYRPAGAPFSGLERRHNALGELHRFVGPDYLQKLVIPEVSSVLMEASSDYEPEGLYKGRPEIETRVKKEAQARLAARYVDLDGFLIKKIVLPDHVRESIERKLVEEQEAERYAFRLKKESQEANRKRIEAQGIRDYQRIISAGLTDAYLRYKGIEATEQLATSPNSKTIVVGGANGLPLILNPETVTRVGPANAASK